MYRRCFCGMLLLALTHCQGRLTDAQRREAAAAIEKNRIQKIAPSEITSTALFYGRALHSRLQEAQGTEEHIASRADSLQEAYGIRIRLLSPTASGLGKTEKTLLEAYSAIADSALRVDDVQPFGDDTLIYTTPASSRDDRLHTAGSVWAFFIPVRNVVYATLSQDTLLQDHGVR